MKTAISRLTSLFCAWALLLAAPCALAAEGAPADSVTGTEERAAASRLAGTYTEGRASGSTAMDKLSRSEILRLLEDAPLALPDSVFDSVPACAAPFAAGAVKTSVLQAAADRLNALRRIAGLPQAALDAELCRQAQYGAVLLGSSDFSHSPAQPDGMSVDFYKAALSATSSSNIYAGRSLTWAVDGFMDDSDSSNIGRLGHRRWQLNPAMGKVGFGYAVSSARYGQFVAEKVFDRSGAACSYDFIAWPASGYFPASLFSGSTAWSVTLNPDLYAVPSAAAVSVTVTGEGGKRWTMDAGGGDGYFNVDTNSYGVPNCIIFRPDGISAYEGVYSVRIGGLRTKDGQAVEDFSYQVSFFREETDPAADQDTAPAARPDPTGGAEAAFWDVPASHWAYADIQRAAGLGIVNGYEDGSFHPAGPVGGAHFSAMLARAFYGGELAASGTGGSWWSPAARVCRNHGLLDGTALGEDASGSLSRCDMARMLYNVLLDQGGALPGQSELRQARQSIRDWEAIPAGYRDAVSACYALGLLNGTDGSFSGGSGMDRAQACAVLCRLMDHLAA